MARAERDGGAVAARGESPSRDDLFEMLSNRRRRFVRHYLRQSDEETVDISNTAKQVAAWEHGVGLDEIDYEDRQSVHISLYQHHVPKLDEAGLVDYDERAGDVRLATDNENIDVYLEAVPERDVPWGLYFPALSAVVGVIVLVRWLGLVSLGLPGIAWAIFAVVAFGVSSLAFLYDTRYRMRIGARGPPPGRE